jgi:hypothetical protein
MPLLKAPHAVEDLSLDSLAEKEHSRRAEPEDFQTQDLDFISTRDVRALQHAHARSETESMDRAQKPPLDPAGKENAAEKKLKKGGIYAGSEPSSGREQSIAEHKTHHPSSRFQPQASTDAMPVLQKGNFQLAHDPASQPLHRSSHRTSAKPTQHATKSTLHRDEILKHYNDAKEQHKLLKSDSDPKEEKWDDSYSNMHNSRPSFKIAVHSPSELLEDKSRTPSPHALRHSRPKNTNPKTNLTLPIPHSSYPDKEKSLVSDFRPAPFAAYPSAQVHKSKGHAIGGIVVGIMILFLMMGVVFFNAGRKRGRLGGKRGRGWMRLGSWRGDKGSGRERLVAGEDVEGREGQGHWDNSWELEDYSGGEPGKFVNDK